MTRREMHNGNAQGSTTGVLLTKPRITCAEAVFTVQSIALTHGNFFFTRVEVRRYMGCPYTSS
jgi:hypothetical protein